MHWKSLFRTSRSITEYNTTDTNEAKRQDEPRVADRVSEILPAVRVKHDWRLRFLRARPNTSELSKLSTIEIYYGTMFGSAERYARSLANDISNLRHVHVVVQDLDGFEESSFSRDRLGPNRIFIFVVSTHFAGSASPSAERFHNWIHDLVAQARCRSWPVHATGSGVAVSSPTSAMSRFRMGKSGASGSRSHPALPLKGMLFAVFGVGDSNYLTFNGMGKSVDTKLRGLGGTRVVPLGLGDCSGDLHGIFKAWEKCLLNKIPRQRDSVCVLDGIQAATASAVERVTKASDSITSSVMRRLSMSPSVTPASPATCTISKISTKTSRFGSFKAAALSPKMSLVYLRDNFGNSVHLRFVCVNQRDAGDLREQLNRTSARTQSPSSVNSLPRRPRTPRIALFDERPFAEILPVERVGRLSSRMTERTCGVFRVRLLDPATTYTTVSTLAIFPHNRPEDVEAVGKAFEYDLDAVIELYIDESRNGSEVDARSEQQQLPFPTPCTIRVALTEFIELRTVSREFVLVASGFVTSLDDKRVLDSLLSVNDSSVFRTDFQARRRGLLDLIIMAPTLKIPLAVLINLVQPIKPRYFTIASSPRISPREFDIAIALGSSNQPRGLAASFVDRILSSQDPTPVNLRGFVIGSRFQFHDDGISPMVFIASGVGFTAMRAILQDRLAQLSQSQQSAYESSMPKHLLFLGAADEDSVVFHQDLRRWEQQLVVKVHHAYSNDPRFPRRYVQDVVASRIDEIVQTVASSNASHVFVCGRVGMVRRIREIFEKDQWNRHNKWFDAIHNSGRFIEEGYK